MTQSSTRRTQAERTAISKDKILLEAARLFSENGYKGTSLAKIAKAANLTEPGVLHHFQSKENLLLHVLEERDRVDGENYFRFINNTEFNFLNACKKLIEHNEKVPYLVQLFTLLVAESIPPDQPGHDFFVQRYQNIREIVINQIDKAKERGEIRKDVSTDDLATMLIAMMDGLQIQWLMNPDSIQMSKIFAQFIDFITFTGDKK